MADGDLERENGDPAMEEGNLPQSRWDSIMERFDAIPTKYLRTAGAIGLTAIGAIGAMFALRGGDNSTDNYATEYATGYEFSQQTNEDQSTNLERVVIHGRQFYVEKTEDVEGQLGFRFLPFEESSRIRDLDSGNYRVESETSYTPERVQGEFTEDRWADELNLTTNYSSETNVNGLRAEILSQEELRRSVGAPENSQGFSGEDTTRYGIRKMSIFGEEYFYPHVESSETGVGRNLDFYLVPVEGTELKIRNSDGRITIMNNNNIYRPRSPETSASLEENAGQAQTVTGS